MMQRYWIFLLFSVSVLAQPWAVKGKTVYTMDGTPIQNGVVLVKDGKIETVGAQASVTIPANYKVLEAAIVTPGLIDAHSVVGLAGYLNQPHDQDQLESSSPMQPYLRALDAYNAREELVGWVRNYGITTLHTGHGPGALVSGQTMLVKTTGETVDEAVIQPQTMVAVTLGESARQNGGKPPGTRAKMMAMLRSKLLAAKVKAAKKEAPKESKKKKGKKKKSDSKPSVPEPMSMEDNVWNQVITGELPLLVTVDRAQDIANALRLVDEFGIKLVLDSAAEAYMMIDQIKAKNVPVIVHPTMTRTFGEKENASMETAAKLAEAGIAVAFQSGFEGYVPKTRVVLFEAAIAAANGMGMESALRAITKTPAEILGIADRVGSLKAGMDADLVLFDGDPFEYTSHVQGVMIEGVLVSDKTN